MKKIDHSSKRYLFLIILLLTVGVVSSATYITSDYIETNGIRSLEDNFNILPHVTLHKGMNLTGNTSINGNILFGEGQRDNIITFDVDPDYPFVLGTDYSEGNDFKINWGPGFYDDDDLFTIDWYTGEVKIGYGANIAGVLNASEIITSKIYEQKHYEIVTTPRWYRFAKTNIDDKNIDTSVFEIKWTKNNLEQNNDENTGRVKFEINLADGVDDSLNFKVLSSSQFVTPLEPNPSKIENVRVIMNGSNNEVYLEFYKSGEDSFHTNIYQHASQDWTLIPFNVGQVPLDYSVYTYPLDGLYSVYSDGTTDIFNLDQDANLGLGQMANSNYKLSVKGNTLLSNDEGWIKTGNGGGLYWNSTHTCIVGSDGSLTNALCN